MTDSCLESLPVIRITLPYLYELACVLEPLGALNQSKVAESPLWRAEVALRQLLDSSVYSPELRSSVAQGTDLLKQISEQLDKYGEDEEAVLTPIDCHLIAQRYDQFRTVFVSEIGVWPSYFVSRKGGYDTLTLLDAGESLFPNSLLGKAPEATFDAREAAKALAFECCTAAGFHAYRCLESILRRYWAHVANGTAEPKVRSIGVYVRAMKDNSLGDEKVLAALDQINKLHRNPLIHPQIKLNMDEVITVIGIARSAIALMLLELPDAELTVNNAFSA